MDNKTRLELLTEARDLVRIKRQVVDGPFAIAIDYRLRTIDELCVEDACSCRA